MFCDPNSLRVSALDSLMIRMPHQHPSQGLRGHLLPEGLVGGCRCLSGRGVARSLSLFGCHVVGVLHVLSLSIFSSV